MQTEPEENVLPPAAWYFLGTWFSFLGGSQGLRQCPPLKGWHRAEPQAPGELGSSLQLRCIRQGAQGPLCQRPRWAGRWGTVLPARTLG